MRLQASIRKPKLKVRASTELTFTEAPTKAKSNGWATLFQNSPRGPDTSLAVGVPQPHALPADMTSTDRAEAPENPARFRANVVLTAVTNRRGALQSRSCGPLEPPSAGSAATSCTGKMYTNITPC